MFNDAVYSCTQKIFPLYVESHHLWCLFWRLVMNSTAGDDITFISSSFKCFSLPVVKVLSMRDSVSSEMNTAQYLPQTLVQHGVVINGIISVISSTSDLSTCQESISRTLERLTLWNICYKAAGGKLQLSSIFINSFFPRVFTQYLAIPYSFKPCSAFGWFFIVSNCQVLGKRSSYFRTLVLRKMMYIYFFGLFLAVIIFYKIQLLYRVLQLLITNKMKSLNRHKKIMK